MSVEQTAAFGVFVVCIAVLVCLVVVGIIRSIDRR